MKKMPLHIIQKVTVQVEFEEMEEALGLQNDLSLLFYEKIRPGLEKVFSEYGEQGQTYILDRLELDCGILDRNHWEELLCAKVENVINKGLKEHLSIDTASQSEKEYAQSIFFYFLEQGHFPWNNHFNNLAELEKEISIDAPLVHGILDLISRKKYIINRLQNSFSQQFQNDLFQKSVELFSPSTNNIISLFKQCTGKDFQYLNTQSILPYWANIRNNPHPIENYCWQILIDEVSITKVGISNGEFIRKIGSDPLLKRSIGKYFLSKAVPGKHREFINHCIKESKFTGIDIFGENEINENEETPRDTSGQFKLEISTPPESDNIYIENAGLVLLHPFLTMFFKEIKLTDDITFNGQEEIFLGIEVLEYLVWGDSDHGENHFPLNKILCGLQPFDLFVKSKGLPDDFRKESENMLIQVIRHWEKLKNTGIDGFRETFLQRAGKLSKIPEGWKLQVEGKSFDVLLASLPWGYGVIKLPWMNEMIYVEWG